MYKPTNKKRLEQSKPRLHWLKRKIVLIMTAFMLGMSNGMQAQDRTLHGNNTHTEQQDRKD